MSALRGGGVARSQVNTRQGGGVAVAHRGGGAVVAHQEGLLLPAQLPQLQIETSSTQLLWGLTNHTTYLLADCSIQGLWNTCPLLLENSKAFKN